MIIDTTISTMENWMRRSARSDERKSKTEYRHSAIRDFLIKQGKDPGHSMNYVAFWRDGEVLDVHLLREAAEKTYIQEQEDKFELFMQYCPGLVKQNSQRNQELSE